MNSHSSCKAMTLSISKYSNSIKLLLLYLLILLVSTYINQKTALTDYLNNLDLDKEILSVLLDYLDQNKWKSFILSPCLMIFRIVAVSACFFIGKFVFPEMSKQNFFDWINISIKAQFIFVGFSVIMVLINLITGVDNTNVVYKNISILYFFKDIDFVNNYVWTIPSLTAINLIELLYWFILSFLISRQAGTKFNNSFGYVAKTYGLGFLFFCLSMTFLLFKMY